MAKSEDQPAPDCSKPSNACIWFLDNLELYRTEKPYDLDYEPEDDDVPSTNFVRTAHDVHVKDLRDGQGKCLSYESCGFAVLGMKSQLTIKDCDETQKLQDLYLHNLQQKLCEFYGTPHVVKFGHKVRKRHATFPISIGQGYEAPQPVLMAHIDWTIDTINQKVREQLGDKADSILSGRFQYVHAWKPLKGPVRDWPLALCDASTITPSTDFEAADTVYEKRGPDENYQIYYRPEHQWFYLSEQDVSEILLFRQYDSDLGAGSGVPHAAIQNPTHYQQVEPRESIEVEFLIYWQ